jgi:uncharacterized protein YfiM (DUF2279 family)
MITAWDEFTAADLTAGKPDWRLIAAAFSFSALMLLAAAGCAVGVVRALRSKERTQ